MKITQATPIAATTSQPIIPAHYVLELEGTLNALAKGDVIYVPRTNAAKQIMRLITAEVEHELTLQFCASPSTNCTNASLARMLPSLAIITAANAALKAAAPVGATVQPVTNAYQIIAVYEGGGEYDCLVYRSNGESKMRFDATQSYDITNPPPGGSPPGMTTVTPFNYVSQYHLVNKINPTALAALDATYDSLTR